MYKCGHGVICRVFQPVKSILLGDKKEAVGVELEGGDHIYANTVLSNATAHLTFLKLLPQGSLPPDFEATIRTIDYTSPVCKINGNIVFDFIFHSMFLV